VTRGAGRRRAQSLVEFALVVPLFLGVLLLTVEAGRLMIVWSLLSEASREATRTAALTGTTTTTPVVDSALQLTAWFGTTASEVTVMRNGTPVTGTLTKQRGDVVKVRIVHPYAIAVAGSLGPMWPGMSLPWLSIAVETQMRAEG
jgi:Flp pilus assembly protein TadG